MIKEEKDIRTDEELASSAAAENVETADAAASDAATPAEAADAATSAEDAEASEATPEERVAALEAELAKRKDDYLRLMAEFDNYRKTQLRKLQDSLRYGAEEAMKGLLPVVDDFERGLAALDQTEDVAATREGVGLIYQKFLAYLKRNKVEAIPVAQGDAFDESVHDAVTMFPAPDPSLKGKVVDCVEKGYRYDDKVIRYAKVVVGQ